MSLTKVERDKVEQIKIRLSDQAAQPTRDEIDYLLSLLDHPVVQTAELTEYVLGFCPEKGRGNAILSVEGELTLLGERLVVGLIKQFDNQSAARVERLEAQLQGIMNSLAISQREVERLRKQIPQIETNRQSKLSEFGLRLIGESLLRDRENTRTTPSSKLFQVVYDGASRPIIQTPSGRWLSLSQFDNGRWQSYDREDSDCKIITEALNWLLTHAPEIVKEWETEE